MERFRKGMLLGCYSGLVIGKTTTHQTTVSMERKAVERYTFRKQTRMYSGKLTVGLKCTVRYYVFFCCFVDRVPLWDLHLTDTMQAKGRKRYTWTRNAVCGVVSYGTEYPPIDASMPSRERHSKHFASPGGTYIFPRKQLHTWLAVLPLPFRPGKAVRLMQWVKIVLNCSTLQDGLPNGERFIEGLVHWLLGTAAIGPCGGRWTYTDR